MNGNKLLMFLIAAMGILLWNMPTTISTFNGMHSYGNASSMCEKCHPEIIIELHTGSPLHNNFTCATCHRTEPNVTYQTRNMSGREAHSASMGSCYNCHASLNTTSNPTITLTASPTIILTASPTITLTAGSTTTLTMQ
jgi:hypothetical protein